MAPPADEATARPRTNSRLRGEAPPGLSVAPTEEARQRIGRYEIIKTIGKGAMGVVYKGRDPLLDRIVAVKTISSPQNQGRRVRSAFLERFQREAKAAAKMQHPAIVTIFDVGVDEESGAPFMVLEYLPGESLADRLDRVRLPLKRCCEIALDLASALSFAHRQRIVHRDVKPANVLHAGDNRWKLADFGIARMPDSDLTQVGIFMGTPGYSPPEAIREGRYTPQADVFAWGAVFYELLCGRIPYEGPDTKTTNSYVVQGNAPPPTRHDSSIPEPLVTVTMTALKPGPENRFKDASEAEQSLRDAWDRCLTQGLVHPAVLVMDETPHDKIVAGRMHELRGRPAPGPMPPPVPMDSQVTDVDKLNRNDPFLIESSMDHRGTGDDDPTRVVMRDDLRPPPPKGDSTVQGVGLPRFSHSGDGPIHSGDGPNKNATSTNPNDRSAIRIMGHGGNRGDVSAPPTIDERPRFGQSIAERKGDNRRARWIWISIIALVLASAAVAALYFADVIK